MAVRKKAAVPVKTAPVARRSRLDQAAVKRAGRPARKPLQIGSASITGALVIFLILGAWGLSITWLLISGDPLANRLISETGEMQDRYEESLNAYRSEIKRLAEEVEESKLGQSDVGQTLAKLGRRQREIELRLQALQKLSEFVAGRASPLPALEPSGTPAPPVPPAPPARDRRGSLETLDAWIEPASFSGLSHQSSPMQGERLTPAFPAILVNTDPPAAASGSSPTDIFLGQLETRLIRAERAQEQVMTAISRQSEGRVDDVRSALREIGITPEGLAPSKTRSEPYFPNITLPISEQKSAFAQRIQKIRNDFILIHRMRDSVQALPISMPTPTNIRFSSQFGYRKHPIAGIMRLHAGLDMAAPEGTPIRAAGSGTILSAAWGGGYGNLIQISHGNGIITRYAHLSKMEVNSGQPVSAGALIGRMGTTGASTGSHLHFETRVHGTPANPACFLIAGDKLAKREVVPYSCEKRPNWVGSINKDEEEEDDDQ